MTRLRPLVIPAAVLLLAAGAPSADARTRGPVRNVWVTAPGPALPTVAGMDLPFRALPAQAAIPLPLAVRVTPGEEAAVPGGRQPAAAGLTGTAVAGRRSPATARGPPR
jgi:hypothetical protein